MLNEDDYETLKETLIESQRLFDKLNRVADQASEIDYDESGLYQDDEEMYQRHWLKLSSKIVDSLSEALQTFDIELLKNESLEDRELFFKLKRDEQTSSVSVDYSQKSALSISQIS